MLRTRHINQGFARGRMSGLALATLAMIVAVGCGGERKSNRGGEPVIAATTPVADAGPTGSGSGGDTGSLEKIAFDDAEAAYKEKRYGEAVRMFTTYADQRPDNPWGHYMLGLSAWKSGDLVSAESAFVRTLELDPRHLKSLLNLSRVLLEQGHPKAARERVTAALTVDSTSGEGYRLLGRVRNALNQPNEAMVAYRMALSLDPTDTWSMNNQGLILIQQQRYEESLAPLARAVQLESGVAVFQNNLGIALEHTGRFGLATTAYHAAIAADNGYTKAVLSLARVDGRKEDTTLMPLDLASLAESFDREIRNTKVSATVTKKDTVPPER